MVCAWHHDQVPNSDPRNVLESLKDEVRSLPASTSSAEYTSWNSRTRSALTRYFGESHHITQTFINMRWTPGAYTLGDTTAFPNAFRHAVPRAAGLLDAAIAELDALDDLPTLEEGEVDSELWEHISADVAAEQWGKVSSQTAIFTEDRIRRWTGQRPELVGEALMSAVFGDNGDYRLGLTAGEKQGWHRLAMGISMALRNADAHRIQQRPDHKLYALGVVGASSLLLTQLRYEHGNRFQDTSSIPIQDSGETE